MMYETKVSHYKDENFEQITMSADFTERQALLTRFKGQKTWSVRGRLHPDSGVYDIEVIKGAQKARALYVAKWFINFG